MSRVVSVGTYDPPHVIEQAETVAFVRGLFGKGHEDIQRLLTIFDNSLIEKRHFTMPKEWYGQTHALQERNDLYIKYATELGIEAIRACVGDRQFLTRDIPCEEIDAIFFVSTTGMATPSIEARIMNRLPFSAHTKRVPIWGLGCAGGVSGIARAGEYCTAFPRAKVIVIALELCSLTFQPEDLSKSNLVGTSLFADGVACVLVTGDDVELNGLAELPSLPYITVSQTTLMPDSERIMGWDVKNDGLFVIFSRDIPDIIRRWLKGNVDEFLTRQKLTRRDIQHLVAHPGGRKVLEAYQDALEMTEEMTAIPRAVLRDHGNMSSPSVLYVLKECMRQQIAPGEIGLMTALGPGFTSELLLLKWL
jgi:alkylresorcinol/alkylpyrone synthase